MTQRELIIFCKENDPNYTKEASFKRLEPMWSIPKGIGGLGITESEFKNGFYVEIDTKGRKGFEHLEGRVFYFREKVDPSKFCFQIYKKFYVPLNALENWGKEIVKEDCFTKVKNEDLVDKPTVFPVPKELIVSTEFVEEFPIQKIQGKTTYRKRKSFIIVETPKITKLINLNIFDDSEETELSISLEEFSDLVDLMIEARKDLLK